MLIRVRFGNGGDDGIDGGEHCLCTDFEGILLYLNNFENIAGLLQKNSSDTGLR